jgi:hypothetical protein
MDLLTFSFHNVFALLQQMSVYLVIAYLFTKSPFFRSFHIHTLHPRQLLLLYFVFSTFSILGTYFGLQVSDAIANTRAIGAVLAGIIGGPLLGGGCRAYRRTPPFFFRRFYRSFMWYFHDRGRAYGRARAYLSAAQLSAAPPPQSDGRFSYDAGGGSYSNDHYSHPLKTF